MILPGGLLEAMSADHRSHRVSLVILKDESATYSILKKTFSKLALDFTLYVRREEKVVYQFMLGTNGLKAMAIEGKEKLHIIQDLFKELKKIPVINKKIWREKAKVIAELVEHHTKEEEFTFAALRANLSDEMDKRLQTKYKKVVFV